MMGNATFLQYTVSVITVYRQCYHSIPSVLSQYTVSVIIVYRQCYHSIPSVLSQYTVSVIIVYRLLQYTVYFSILQYTVYRLLQYTVYYILQRHFSIPSVLCTMCYVILKVQFTNFYRFSFVGDFLCVYSMQQIVVTVNYVVMATLFFTFSHNPPSGKVSCFIELLSLKPIQLIGPVKAIKYYTVFAWKQVIDGFIAVMQIHVN